MATNSKGNRAEVSKMNGLLAGLQKDLPPTSKLTLLGTSLLVSAIVSQIQGWLKLNVNVQTTKAAWQAAVAAQKQAMPTIKPFVESLIAVLKQQLGASNPELQDFGIAPPKAKKQPTAEQKAVAVALGKQTKAVRGPTGKNQRAEVTVQGKPGMVLVTPTGTPVTGLTQGPTPPAGQQPANEDQAPTVGVPAVNASGTASK